jgi:hypothetical protein
MITLEKIKIFNSYGGDIDGLARNSRSNDHNLIEDKEWALIDNFFQDIELITKGLAAQTYVDQSLRKIKENCDNSSFNFLTQKITFYQDFQSVATILKEIKNKINQKTDTVWAGFDNADIFLVELNHDIERLELCDFETLNKIQVEFAPTCTYQELSMTNGWSVEYLKLAEEFDALFDKLTKKKTAHNTR